MVLVMNHTIFQYIKASVFSLEFVAVNGDRKQPSKFLSYRHDTIFCRFRQSNALTSAGNKKIASPIIWCANVINGFIHITIVIVIVVIDVSIVFIAVGVLVARRSPKIANGELGMTTGLAVYQSININSIQININSNQY